jgi:hypothetical protein
VQISRNKKATKNLSLALLQNGTGGHVSTFFTAQTHSFLSLSKAWAKIHPAFAP